MVTAILKIKTSLAEAAAEALAVFGEGGNPEASQVEDFLGIVNTPEINGYVRIAVPEAFGMALEHIDANGGSEHADLIRVEWEGQQEFQIGVTEEAKQPVELEDGTIVDPQPIYLGMIA